MFLALLSLSLFFKTFLDCLTTTCCQKGLIFRNCIRSRAARGKDSRLFRKLIPFLSPQAAPRSQFRPLLRTEARSPKCLRFVPPLAQTWSARRSSRAVMARRGGVLKKNLPQGKDPLKKCEQPAKDGDDQSCTAPSELGGEASFPVFRNDGQSSDFHRLEGYHFKQNISPFKHIDLFFRSSDSLIISSR